MSRRIVFPKRAVGNNILKLYGVFTDTDLSTGNCLNESSLFFDSVDSAIDEAIENGIDINGCTIVELSIPERQNLNLSSVEVVKMFEYLYNVLYKDMHMSVDTDNIDNELLRIYLRSYATDISTVSRIIMGDKHPYDGSKLLLGTKIIYSIVDATKIDNVRYFSIVSQSDDNFGTRTLIIPK